MNGRDKGVGVSLVVAFQQKVMIGSEGVPLRGVPCERAWRGGREGGKRAQAVSRGLVGGAVKLCESVCGGL